VEHFTAEEIAILLGHGKVKCLTGYVLASEAEAEIARLLKALDCRSVMKCKCGAKLYRVSGLTHYDNRDGIREAAWCDSCRILFSSHAHGLNVIGYLHNKLESSDDKKISGIGPIFTANDEWTWRCDVANEWRGGKMIPNREYNPSCFMCRKIAGKEPAGVHKASLCFHHLQEHCFELKERERVLVEALEYYAKATEIYRMKGVNQLAQDALEQLKGGGDG
jgi:hypothetical protein